jgi:predicted RecB family endonuclease
MKINNKNKVEICIEFQDLIFLSESLKNRLFDLYDLLSENGVNIQNLDKKIDEVIEKFENMKGERIIDALRIEENLAYLKEFKRIKEVLRKIEITNVNVKKGC